MAFSGDLEPSDDVLVVITMIKDGELAVLVDAEYDDEVAVYLSGDPEVDELVEAAREVYGPSARAMLLEEFTALSQAHGQYRGEDDPAEADTRPCASTAAPAGRRRDGHCHVPGRGGARRCGRETSRSTGCFRAWG
jgi:hypothetical protein